MLVAFAGYLLDPVVRSLMGYPGQEALALPGTAIEPHQIRAEATFIDKYQLPHIQAGDGNPPA